MWPASKVSSVDVIYVAYMLPSGTEIIHTTILFLSFFLRISFTCNVLLCSYLT